MACNLVVFERVDGEGALFTFFIALVHVFALLYGADCRGVCRRSPDAQLFQLVHEACLGVPERPLAETLGGGNLFRHQFLTLAHGGQYVAVGLVVMLLFVVIRRLAVYFQKTVELNHLARCHELRHAFVARFRLYAYRHGGLLNLRVGHLACRRAFPDEVVEAFLLCGAVYLMVVHICGAYRLVRFLRSFRVRMVLPFMAVFLSPHFYYLVFACVEAQ